MLCHHITPDQVTWLEGYFAYLTPHGWVIPAWVLSLNTTAAEASVPNESTTRQQALVASQLALRSE